MERLLSQLNDVSRFVAEKPGAHRCAGGLPALGATSGVKEHTARMVFSIARLFLLAQDLSRR